MYLESFRLPGESQKINRVMESFGQRYHAQCPDLFKNPDAVYILGYSTIMLNTDQHNNQVGQHLHGACWPVLLSHVAILGCQWSWLPGFPGHCHGQSLPATRQGPLSSLSVPG